MADKQWTFELSEAAPPGGETAPFAPRRRSHTVALHHTYWTTNRRTVLVDGQPLSSDALHNHPINGAGSDDLFELDGHTCHVWIRPSGFTRKYDLAVDGISVQTGAPVVLGPEVVPPAPRHSGKVPWWGWMFFVPLLASVLVGYAAAVWMLLSLNVRVPSAPAFTIIPLLTGYIAILSIAADYSLSKPTRILHCILACLGSTVGAFVLTVLLVLMYHPSS